MKKLLIPIILLAAVLCGCSETEPPMEPIVYEETLPELSDTLPDDAVFIGENENGAALYRSYGGYTVGYQDGTYRHYAIEGEYADALLGIANKQVGDIIYLLDISDGSYRFKVIDSAPNIGLCQITERIIGEDEIVSIGKYDAFAYDFYVYVVDTDSGEIARKVTASYVYTLGEVLIIEDEFMGLEYWVCNSSLTPLSEAGFDDFVQLTDGRFMGLSEGKLLIFASDGEIISEFEVSGEVLMIGADFIFCSDSDNMLCLYHPDGELLCRFGEAPDGMRFIKYRSGWYDDGECPSGFYFMFTEDAQMGVDRRTVEYFYASETGGTGKRELGPLDYVYAKPVLYLYPEEVTDVTVQFVHPERLTTVYPAYDGGWRVTASPDGTLTDVRGREYYALYWEEDGTAEYRFTEGFCVASEDSAAFLEEKLAALGFTEREANEFIIYWLPVLEASKYNLISFELTESREETNALFIDPAPDSMLRMAMHVRAVDAPLNIPEQDLPQFNREGYVAVEWGGCVHSHP